MMKSEILKNIPESGSFEEVRFDAFGGCTWVKFQDSEYIDWLGVFGYGWGGGAAIANNSNGVSFVLSNGQGYIVDINSRKLLHKTECDYLKLSIACTSQGFFVTATDVELYVYDQNGLLFTTKRIASDGIVLNECNNGKVSGRVYGFDKWYPFSLKIKNQEYKCSWSCPLE